MYSLWHATMVISSEICHYVSQFFVVVRFAITCTTKNSHISRKHSFCNCVPQHFKAFKI